MMVNREYMGETPSGMKFSTLASMAGGGQQVPGFIGVGKTFATSRKFIAAEGGHKRIVWMPTALKEALREDLERIGKRLGIDNFLDIIADETISTESEGVMESMAKGESPSTFDVGYHRTLTGGRSRGCRQGKSCGWVMPRCGLQSSAATNFQLARCLGRVGFHRQGGESGFGPSREPERV